MSNAEIAQAQVVATKLACVARRRGHSIRAVAAGGVEIATGCSVTRIQVTTSGLRIERGSAVATEVPAGLSYTEVVHWVEGWMFSSR